MILRSLSAVALCSFTWLFSQNLVPNPSFEICSGYPSGTGQWSLLNSWTSPSSGSPDYNHALGGASAGVPNNTWGSQPARTGQAYVSLAYNFPGSYFEYLQAPLISPLVVGDQYYCEMYVSSVNNFYNRGMDHMGFCFRNGSTTGTGYLNLPMQVFNTVPICDMTNWVQISGTFTATSAYNYVIIGNTTAPATTGFCTYASGGTIATAMYYVEDVLVQPVVILDESVCALSVQPSGEHAISVSWNQTAGTAVRYYTVERSSNGTDFQQVAQTTTTSWVDTPGIYGQPVYYRIKVTLDDGSVQFSQIKETSVAQPGASGLIQWYPNPVVSGNDIHFSWFAVNDGQPVEIRFFDLAGKLAYQSVLHVQTGAQDLLIGTSPVPVGTYWVELSSDGARSITRCTILP